MNIQSLGFDGLYQFEKRKVVGFDANGDVVLSEAAVVLPWFGNLITNQGLDLLAVDSDKLSFCQLGTSNTTPDFSDTALGARVNATSSAPVADVYGVSTDQSYLYRRVTRRFAAGSVSGVNLTEVGMSAASSSGLFSRALLKDLSGNVTTITLSADEVLDVVYELRCYVSTVPVVVGRTIDGVSVDITMKPYQYPSGDAWIGNAENGFSGAKGLGVCIRPTNPVRWQATLSEKKPFDGTGNILSINPVINTYVPGSYRFTSTFAVPVGAAAWPAGTNSILQGHGAESSDSRGIGRWTFELSSKLNTATGRTAEFELGLSWGRHTP